MFNLGLQEFIVLIVLIVFLTGSGLWPKIMRALRELRGENFPSEPSASSDDIELCCRLLGVSPSASWEEVERAYRGKAKVHHPDRGGDQDAMRALNEAYARIKKARGPQRR